MHRRDAMKLALGAGVATVFAGMKAIGAPAGRSGGRGEVAARLTIGSVEVDLAAGNRLRTLAFNGAVSGPVLECHPGPMTLELCNDSDEEVRLQLPASTEGLIVMQPGTAVHACVPETRSSEAVPDWMAFRAFGARSGSVATGVLSTGASRQRDRGAYDRLQLLTVQRWQARSISRVGPFNDTSVAYDYASLNGDSVSHGEPIKVRYGERVRFHVMNTSTTQAVTLALPKHRFLITRFEGYSVPAPRKVDRLYLGPSESVDAFVMMDQPGKWIFGSTHRVDRAAGLGRVIEYAGAHGKAEHGAYGVADWDYTTFGSVPADVPSPSERTMPPLLLRAPSPMALTDPALVDPTPRVVPLSSDALIGHRYKVSITNHTRDPQSLQILGHGVELLRVTGRRTAGVHKAAVTLPSQVRMELGFIALSQTIYLAHSPLVAVHYS